MNVLLFICVQAHAQLIKKRGQPPDPVQEAMLLMKQVGCTSLTETSSLSCC